MKASDNDDGEEGTANPSKRKKSVKRGENGENGEDGEDGENGFAGQTAAQFKVKDQNGTNGTVDLADDRCVSLSQFVLCSATWP
jgi:hypothetical protein